MIEEVTRVLSDVRVAINLKDEDSRTHVLYRIERTLNDLIIKYTDDGK